MSENPVDYGSEIGLLREWLTEADSEKKFWKRAIEAEIQGRS